MEPHQTLMNSNLTKVNAVTGQTSVVASYAGFRDNVWQTSNEGNFKSPNAYSATWQYARAVRATGYRATAYTQTWSTIYNFYGPSQLSLQKRFTPSVRKDAVYNEALSKLVEKVRGGLDLSVDLAESRQTQAMLRELGTAQRYFSGLGPKRWANEWLQLQYGWLPLLSSLYGVTEELIDHADLLCTVKAGARMVEPIQGNVSVGTADISGVGDYLVSPASIAGVGESTYYCSIKVRLTERDRVENLARWTSLNPLSIAWELTPYSFVVDWFYNVGDFLRNLETSYLFGTAFRDGYVTEGNALELRQTVNYSDYSTPAPAYGTKVRKWVETSDFNEGSVARVVLQSFPGPRLPTVNVDLSWRRWTSLGALLAQRFIR